MPRCSWCEREWTCGRQDGGRARPAWFGCLALTLALDHLLYFALLRTAGNVGGPFGLGRHLLAGCALQLLAFVFVGNFFGIHSTLIPAYFAINFFKPYPGKLTVTFVSSPEPSRRSTVPRPHLVCSTVEPGPNFRGPVFLNCGTGAAGWAVREAAAGAVAAAAGGAIP